MDTYCCHHCEEEGKQTYSFRPIYRVIRVDGGEPVADLLAYECVSCGTVIDVSCIKFKMLKGD